MKLICCLGNPGDDYKNTRHNIGFQIADALIDTFNLEKIGKKFKSIAYQGQIEGEKCLLLKPQTYMNLSGEAVQPALALYKLTAKDLLVIYDDFDLPLGTLRLKEKGSAGTHNGMKSIITHLKTPEFPRLRIGIGPKPEFIDTSSFVLGRFQKEETEQHSEIFEKSIESIKRYLTQPIEAAMKYSNTLNKAD